MSPKFLEKQSTRREMLRNSAAFAGSVAEEIARKNGFGNRDRMRRSFLRAVGQPPQAGPAHFKSVRPANGQSNDSPRD